MTHENSPPPWNATVALSLFVGVMLGCQRPLEMHFPESAPTARYQDAESDKKIETGQLGGVVQWSGEKPVPETIRGLIDTLEGAVWSEVANPFAPTIDKTGRMAGVVVQVLNPPAVITERWRYGEVKDFKLTQVGFDLPSFIKVGSEVSLRSEEKYSQIRARGASFFTRSFISDGAVQTATLDQPGCVEFTKTNGEFWINSRVWICSHPYFAKSDDQGAFDLGQLPPGEYDIQASIPNWQIVGRDRDPETGRVMQLHRGPDITVVQRVKIEAGKHLKITLKLSAPQD